MRAPGGTRTYLYAITPGPYNAMACRPVTISSKVGMWEYLPSAELVGPHDATGGVMQPPSSGEQTRNAVRF